MNELLIGARQRGYRTFASVFSEPSDVASVTLHRRTKNHGLKLDRRASGAGAIFVETEQ